MSHLIRRSLLGAAVATGLATGAPAAHAAGVTLKVSSAYAYVGGTTTATVTSDTSGTISLYQLRSGSYQGGAGRCFFGQYGYVGGLTFELSKPVTKVAVTAGKPVSVKIAGDRLAYAGGSLLDSLYHPDPDACTDPLTQFTKLGAFLDVDPSFIDDRHDIRSLTRVL